MSYVLFFLRGKVKYNNIFSETDTDTEYTLHNLQSHPLLTDFFN